MNDVVKILDEVGSVQFFEILDSVVRNSLVSPFTLIQLKSDECVVLVSLQIKLKPSVCLELFLVYLRLLFLNRKDRRLIVSLGVGDDGIVIVVSLICRLKSSLHGVQIPLSPIDRIGETFLGSFQFSLLNIHVAEVSSGCGYLFEFFLNIVFGPRNRSRIFSHS